MEVSYLLFLARLLSENLEGKRCIFGRMSRLRRHNYGVLWSGGGKYLDEMRRFCALTGRPEKINLSDETSTHPRRSRTPSDLLGSQVQRSRALGSELLGSDLAECLDPLDSDRLVPEGQNIWVRTLEIRPSENSDLLR